jgi:hypothetical protein
MERSNCRSHLPRRCRFVDRCLGVTPGKSRLVLLSRCRSSSRRASSFCPARFYGAPVVFVDGEKRSERNEHVSSVDESERISAAIPSLSETRVEPTDWSTNGREEYRIQNRDTTLPGIIQCAQYRSFLE